MFSSWKQQKATATLVEEATALAVKLAEAKPHVRDSHAAAALFWEAYYLAAGQNLHDLMRWQPPAVARFATTAQTKIAALRKSRDYDSSDGLAVWLHTARAVTEPQIAPAVREIWLHLTNAGPNAATMGEDLLRDADLPATHGLRVPYGFCAED